MTENTETRTYESASARIEEIIRRLDSGDAGLRGCRHIWQHAGTRLAGGGERAHLVLADIGGHRRNRVDHHLHLSADDAAARLAAVAVGNVHDIDAGHGFEQFAGHVIGRALAGRGVVQLSRLRFGECDEFRQRLCRDLRVHDDDKVGVIDRRDRRQIAHQFIFARRHQRFVRGLGIRHHQQRIAVRR